MIKWRDENRDDWNDYQKNYKVRKRFEVVQNIEKEIIELEIAEKGTMEFSAAVILLFMTQTGIKREWAIRYRTDIKSEDIRTIIKNWTKCGIWDHNNAVFNLEEDWNTVIGIVLLSLAGSGKIIRIMVE